MKKPLWHVMLSVAKHLCWARVIAWWPQILRFTRNVMRRRRTTAHEVKNGLRIDCWRTCMVYPHHELGERQHLVERAGSEKMLILLPACPTRYWPSPLDDVGIPYSERIEQAHHQRGRSRSAARRCFASQMLRFTQHDRLAASLLREKAFANSLFTQHDMPEMVFSGHAYHARLASINSASPANSRFHTGAGPARR